MMVYQALNPNIIRERKYMKHIYMDVNFLFYYFTL